MHPKRAQKATSPDEVERLAKRYYRMRMAFGLVVSLFLTSALIINALTLARVYDVVTLIRGQQVTNTALTTDTHTNSVRSKRLLDTFLDCIDPQGACAKSNAAKTAHVLDQFQSLVVIGNICAANPNVPKTYQGFNECVAAVAEAHGISPSTTPPK